MMVLDAAILLEWSRIFVPHGIRNSFFWTCRTIIFFATSFHAAAILLENLGIVPHHALWDSTVPARAVLGTKASWITGAAINIIVDLVIMVLPQRVIWSLHMPKAKKMGLSVIFIIGVL
jgi:hypothetical protein